MYAHPIEFLVGNVPVVGAGPMILGSHITIWYLWAALAIVETCLSHSGWQLPFLGGNQVHDYHQSTHPSAGAQNLGVTGVLDSFYGTNLAYLRSWQASVSSGYTTPDYPIDKLIAKAEAGGVVTGVPVAQGGGELLQEPLIAVTGVCVSRI